MAAVARADELPDVDVREEDQLMINEFSRLNGRLHEIQVDIKGHEEKLEHLEDATTELMMGGDTVRLKMGEAFLDCSEEYATEYCEKKVTKYSEEKDAMKVEEEKILARQKELKKLLYGRFGKAINLEE